MVRAAAVAVSHPARGGILNRIGLGGVCGGIGKFNPVAFGEIHATGDCSIGFYRAPIDFCHDFGAGVRAP
jgi:hypothetical protein